MFQHKINIENYMGGNIMRELTLEIKKRRIQFQIDELKDELKSSNDKKLESFEMGRRKNTELAIKRREEAIKFFDDPSCPKNMTWKEIKDKFGFNYLAFNSFKIRQPKDINRSGTTK